MRNIKSYEKKIISIKNQLINKKHMKFFISVLYAFYFYIINQEKMFKKIDKCDIELSQFLH